MTAAKPAKTGDFRMSGKEFDRIMGKALQVKPKASGKSKKKVPKKRASK